MPRKKLHVFRGLNGYAPEKLTIFTSAHCVNGYAPE